MVELLKALIANAKGSPVSTAFGFVALGLVGGGKLLSENAMEPWGTAVSGLGAFIAIVLGAAVGKPKPPPVVKEGENPDQPKLPSGDA